MAKAKYLEVFIDSEQYPGQNLTGYTIVGDRGDSSGHILFLKRPEQSVNPRKSRAKANAKPKAAESVAMNARE